ncbi:unnamed protein product [Lepeophtheirus salmonis]|uniref:(salmon louse) hypothetical protein n=1 Tax=Lepeophtheirus salmonis TaxID=72036 RepID=A0A7R8HFC9_LEPSM|nr:unnamed protein product [Lepeophtheirus salmonis]CAF3042422.1 unnamed protein product [Lepeophtheirus salmonis]
MSQLNNGVVGQRNNFSHSPPVITLSKPEEFTVVQIENSEPSQELKSWTNKSSKPPYPTHHHLNTRYKTTQPHKKVQYQIDNSSSSSSGDAYEATNKRNGVTSFSIATNTECGVEILPSDNSSSVLSFPVPLEEDLYCHYIKNTNTSHHNHELPSQNLHNNYIDDSFISKSSSTLLHLLGREKFEKYSRLNLLCTKCPSSRKVFLYSTPLCYSCLCHWYSYRFDSLVLP